MAITYSLAPIPKWYFADRFGKPLGAGKMYTYRNLNKVQQKPVYQDLGGTLPWTNPILFNENGEQGPFYWEFDSDNASDTYYIEVYDRNDVLEFTIENYFPPGGGGGGGGGTTFLNLKNLISNNIFLNNIGSITPTGTVDTVIAPGPHFGFNPAMTDIRFIKTSSVAATDSITFVDFPLGSDPFVSDVTPVQYLRYQCSVAGNETQKVIQLPVTSKVSNLDNQTVTFTIWARCESGDPNLELFQYQFFGNGGPPTPSVSTPVFVQTIELSDQWEKYVVTFAIPNTAGKTLGLCGDDALFLQISYPLSTTTEIWLAKPCLYVGNHNPDKEFETNDQVINEISQARSGDARISINAFAPYGWVEMNDGTIGSSSSGSTSRANIDTFPLFKTIWQQVGATFAPIFTSAGAPSTYGASPEDDFAANKRLSLTKQLGRTIAGIGSATGATRPVTNWALGQFSGEESHVQTIAQMPSHTHPGSVLGIVNQVARADGLGSCISLDPGPNLPLVVNVAAQGGGQAFPIMQPSVHYRIFMKL